MLTSLPLQAKENVTAETRAKVAKLQASDPIFKLGIDAQECLEGKIIDPECEPLVADEVDTYIRDQEVERRDQEVERRDHEVERREQEVERREQEVERRDHEVERREQEVEIAEAILHRAHVVRALIQLGLLLKFDQSPPPDQNYMVTVLTYEDTPSEVRSLIQTLPGQKMRGDAKVWAREGVKILDLARRYIEESISQESKLANSTLLANVSLLNMSILNLFNKASAQLLP